MKSEVPMRVEIAPRLHIWTTTFAGVRGLSARRLLLRRLDMKHNVLVDDTSFVVLGRLEAPNTREHVEGNEPDIRV